jgi:hypothetical protein
MCVYIYTYIYIYIYIYVYIYIYIFQQKIVSCGEEEHGKDIFMDFCHMFPEIAEGVEFKAAETS